MKFIHRSLCLLCCSTLLSAAHAVTLERFNPNDMSTCRSVGGFATSKSIPGLHHDGSGLILPAGEVLEINIKTTIALRVIPQAGGASSAVISGDAVITDDHGTPNFDMRVEAGDDFDEVKVNGYTEIKAEQAKKICLSVKLKHRDF